MPQGLDVQPPATVLALLAEAQVEAAAAVPRRRRHRSPRPQLARRSARLPAAGSPMPAAGSSGLMALADALELPGTFGIPRDRIVILLAGGAAELLDLAGGARGRRDAGRRDVAAAGIGTGDCLIARLGQRHHALCRRARSRRRRRRGAATIGIANNAGAPLLRLRRRRHPAATPPELMAGSTRMGAGTAQKIALNMMSTLVGHPSRPRA